EPRVGTATDPVCGMDVNPSTAREQVEHDGHTYFFCSSGCATKFREDPARYLAPTRTEAAAPAAPTIYTCPMHPEIVREGPGACPCSRRPAWCGAGGRCSSAAGLHWSTAA